MGFFLSDATSNGAATQIRCSSGFVDFNTTETRRRRYQSTIIASHWHSTETRAVPHPILVLCGISLTWQLSLSQQEISAQADSKPNCITSRPVLNEPTELFWPIQPDCRRLPDYITKTRLTTRVYSLGGAVNRLVNADLIMWTGDSTFHRILLAPLGVSTICYMRWLCAI